MMAYSEDHIALAAEYALGTLSAEERVQVETMMSVDKDFVAVVETWERKLGVLNQMVGLVEPRPEVWDRIRVAVGLSGTQEAIVHPPAVQPVTAAIDVPAADIPTIDSSTVTGSAVDRSNVIDFSRQAKRWRSIASGMTAIAAALVAMIAVQAYRPELLPSGLRPKATQQVAQAPVPAPVQPAAAAQAQYVALLQTDGTSPAFILTVDAATKNFTVRKVGAEQQPGKSYELWIVSDKLQRPRSLGVIGSHEFTTRAALAAYDPDTVNQATYAVTVEPEGGSPTGLATGPIVFTGKLIETVPPARR
jgi:anti-sigma-K factor RskA